MHTQAKRFDVYAIKENGDESYWTRIGAAFLNRDQSLNVVLDCLPVNGRLHIREPSASTKEDKE